MHRSGRYRASSCHSSSTIQNKKDLRNARKIRGFIAHTGLPTKDFNNDYKIVLYDDTKVKICIVNNLLMADVMIWQRKRIVNIKRKQREKIPSSSL